MKITICFGTRPEVVKLSKVVEALRARGESPTVVCTNQHTNLLRGTPAEDTMRPDVNLGLPGQENPLIYASDCGHALIDVFSKNRPEVILVQGDTASAYAGATVGKLLGIPVAHVEAGIRSGDLLEPWPEETFRIEIDQIAQWRFAPTEHAYDQLNGYDRAVTEEWHDFVTGNTGIDALYSHTKPVEQSQKVDRVLITLHRRESFGEPLEHIVNGLWCGADEHKNIDFIWPVHPNPEIRKVLNGFGGLPQPSNLAYWHPMGTMTFAQQLAHSRAVITDSGGVQEEAAALGIPCVVAREKTDRPESVEFGLAKVAGRTEAGILAGLAWALDAKIEPSTVFGDGHASERIVEHLLA